MGPDLFGDSFAEALHAPPVAGGLDLEAMQQEIVDTLEQALDHMNAALPAEGDVRATLGPWMTLPGQMTRRFGFERQSDGFEVSAFMVTWETGYPVTVRIPGEKQPRTAEDREELISALSDAMTASAPIARQLAEG